MSPSSLSNILILLVSAVILVTLTHRLGLGSVLGYLLAGLAVGPHGLDLISDSGSLTEVSEMGVVFLLFVIGLELEPKRLWSLRYRLAGMGLGQLALVALVSGAFAWAMGISPAGSVAIGFALALSSTAIAVQILRDRHLFSTPVGQSAFSILLFQDMAVIPLLALVPLLSDHVAPSATHFSPFKMLGALVVILLAGHFLLRPIFRWVAGIHLREIFTGLCLLFVLGLAALLHSFGASMALGAFIGGVLLANSEYRHAVETDIEPFKGLLLGLFFMSVGMTLNLKIVAEQPGPVAAWLFGILTIKILCHAGLAAFSGLPRRELPFFSISISQVGEFAFVLFALSEDLQLLNAEQRTLLTAATALSMACTPLLVLAYDRWWAPRLCSTERPADTIENEHPEVLIAGFGRVGQIIGRLLNANRIRATVLDHDAEQIEVLRQFGFKVYYGDATRLDLLQMAGAGTAQILVVAIDDVESSLKIVDLAREHFPHLKIVARARNLGHVYDLIDRKIHHWERETFESSLKMGVDVLKLMGARPYEAQRMAHQFRQNNLELIPVMHQHRDNRSKMVSASQQAREDLEQMFVRDSEWVARRESWDFRTELRPDETATEVPRST